MPHYVGLMQGDPDKEYLLQGSPRVGQDFISPALLFIFSLCQILLPPFPLTGINP